MADPTFFDIDGFLSHTGNDRTFAKEIAEESLRVIPDYLGQIHSALESGDPAVIRKAAHKLKGGMRTIFAAHAGDAAELMEKTAAAGDAEACVSQRKSLDEACAGTISAIKAFLEE